MDAHNPVAHLAVDREKLKPRKFGLWKGKVWISPDFDEEDEEINKLFYEGEIFPKGKGVLVGYTLKAET